MKYLIDGIRPFKRNFAFRYLALGILIAAVLLGASPVGRSLVNRAPSLPPQGVYESCPPRDGPPCLARLTQIANAGFQLVLNYDQFHGSAEQVIAYATAAQSLHMKIIWGMSDPVFWNGTDLRQHFSQLSATCSCTTNRDFIGYIVNLVKHLPVTWGYYIGDEVKVVDRSKVMAFSTVVHRFDSVHPRLYIAAAGSTTLASKLEPFANTAEVIGADYYPVSTRASLDTVGSVAEAVQSVADQHNQTSAFTLQAFSWSQYPTETWVCSSLPRCARYPTEAEMRMMRDFVLSNAHPAVLLWYSYFDILRSDAPSRHWSDLIAAAGVQPAQTCGGSCAASSQR
ncbi:MAG: hypothetical protein ACXWQ5_16895 [Ktedonobacterales bacterium]